MSDDIHDRRTPIPREGLPPWERKTGAGEKIPGTAFGETQPIKTPTVEDVLEVFGHFRQDLLEQIDKRDEHVLLVIQDIGTKIFDHYERETKRADDHARWIEQLRKRTHKLSSTQQTVNIRLAYIEQRLGIESPTEAPPEEPDLET